MKVTTYIALEIAQNFNGCLKKATLRVYSLTHGSQNLRDLLLLQTWNKDALI